MPSFDYVALNAKGIEKRGNMQVESLDDACSRLKEMGLYPTKVIEQKARPGGAGSNTPAPGGQTAKGRSRSPSRLFNIPLFGGRVKPRALTVFTRQLATMIDAGIPLVRGLRLLRDQESQPALRRAVDSVLASIEGGGSFSEALAMHPRVFNRLYVNMVRAGEAGGALEIVLLRLSEFMEKSERIKARVISAMYYPVAVLMVAAAIVCALMVFIVPRFQEVFRGLMDNKPLPAFTEFVLRISTVFQSHFLLVALGAVGVAVAFRMALMTRAGRALFDRMKLRMPLLGPLFLKTGIARFGRTFGTLLGSGVPVLQALTIVRDTAGNVVFEKAVDSIHDAVKEGETITVPMQASKLFPSTVIGMVDVGEQSGALPDMLMKVADTFEEEVDNTVAGLTSLLEPVLIIFLALVVGTIVIAMFLPLTRIMTDGFDGPGDR
jgi:type IV pilus assembly protein PilC